MKQNGELGRVQMIHTGLDRFRNEAGRQRETWVHPGMALELWVGSWPLRMACE